MSASLSTDWIARLEQLEEQLETVSAGDEEDEREDRNGDELVQVLTNVCALVRDAERKHAPNFDEIVQRAQDVINFGISIAYGSESELFDFLPSFAHNDAVAPLVKDTLTMPFAQGMIDVMNPFFRDFLSTLSGATGVIPPLPGPGPWNKDDQPHAKTSRLARFRPGITVSATDATPIARNIYQARCDVWSDSGCSPMELAVSSGSSCLALAAAGGWKNRDPVLQFYLLDSASEYPLESMKTVNKVGLSQVATELAIDENRKLIFVADDHRIKSFEWNTDSDSDRDSAKPMHTMGDKRHGPIALLPNGRIARAGDGDVAIWNIDELEKHQGRRRIGPGKFDAEDSNRDNDDGDSIELSTGSVAHATVTFAESGFVPGVWHLHEPTASVLCGEKRVRDADDSSFACLAIDLDHGGKTAARFLGHGGDVTDISTSAGDANVFTTAASDGFVRLFDVRSSMPVVTFDSGGLAEPCPAVLLVHPDGIPTIFSAGDSSQQIKMWDVRARALVYELATGNNSVSSLAWDARRSTLFAATVCEYMDRLGYHHDYRRARIPKWAEDHPIRAESPGSGPGEAGEHEEGWVDEDEDEDEDEDDGDDDDDDDYEERCWPKRAFHGENFYGYALDSGENMIYSYVFKEDPVLNLPAYGDATMNESMW